MNMDASMGLFSGWYGYAITACAFIIFLSYQAIPHALSVIEAYGREGRTSFLLSVTSSIYFRAFIRICGTNHIIMSPVMLAYEKGWVEPGTFWQRLLLIGEGATALISLMVAVVAWRVRWALLKS